MLRVLIALVVAAGSADAACNAIKLCEPGENPCVVSAACTVPAGATFDVRPRALVIRKALTVGVGIDATTIVADSITVEPEGDVIVTGSGGQGSIGGTVRLWATKGIETRSMGNTRSRLRADAGLVGGTIELLAGDDVYVSSTVDVDADNNAGLGGTFEVVSTGGSVRIVDNGGGPSIRAAGGNSEEGSGGTVAISAHDSVLLDGEIDASNGSSVAEIAIEAMDGNIVTTSRGRLRVNASVLGDGGTVELTAGGDVTVGGNVEAKGAGTGSGENDEGGYGGTLTVTGVNVSTTASTIDLSGAGPDGDGGELEVEAAGNLVVDTVVLVEVGGIGYGGLVSLFAGGDANVRRRIDADGGDGGGEIAIFAEGDLTVRDQLRATAKYDGGSIEIEGCDVTLPAGASLVTTAAPQPFVQGGENRVTARAQMTIAGSLASAGRNLLRYRSLPPVVTGTVTPAPLLSEVPGLPCCVECPATTTSTSVSSTSSTTSTSASSTVTSSSSSSTTSSSTTTSTSTSSSTTSSSSTSTTATSSSTSVSSTSSSSSSTSTSIATPTTSSSASTSTSTSTTTSSSTSSTMPSECGDVPAATLGAAACRIELIAGDLASRSDEQVGGRKQRRRLRIKVASAGQQVTAAVHLFESGKPARKAMARARRAARILGAFTRKLGKAIERDGVSPDDGARWMRLAREALDELEATRSNAP